MTRRLTIIGLLITNCVLAQQIPLFNQYFVNQVVYNPSYTGYNEGTNITLLRNQKWTGFDGGAIANYLNVGLSLPNDHHSLGIDLYSDYLGFTSKLSAHLGYAYRLTIGKHSNLRFGFAGGVVDNRINFANIVVLDRTDPALSQAPDRTTAFDLNVGLNLEVKKFKWGVSMPQVLGSTLAYGDDGSYVLERQLMSTLSYAFEFGNEDMFSISPMAMGSYLPGAPVYYEGLLLIEHKKFGWLAGGYKNNYAATFSVGFIIKKQLKIGVSYDLVLNALNNYAKQPNAEVVLSYGILPRTDEESSYRKPLFAEGERERLEKLIAAQKVSIDSLNVANDSIAGEASRAERRFREDMAGMNDSIVTLNDSIDELNRMLADLDRNLEKIDSSSTRQPDERFDGVIRKTKDDHFIELDKSESPNGYYVVIGAFGRKSYADRLLSDSKGQFSGTRIIFNERNQLHYVIVDYNTNSQRVFGTAQKALASGHEKAWILNYEK